MTTHPDTLKRGTRVTTLKSQKRYFAQDFPGWDRDDYLDYMPDVTEGLTGTVTAHHSHGSAPYTRYSVALDNGGLLTDAVPGTHFNTTN